MIKSDVTSKIRQLYFAEHFTVHAISEALGIHHATIKRAIGAKEFKRRPREKKETLLDPYRAHIEEKLALYPKLTATRLIQILKDRGYSGSLTTLRVYLAKERPRHVKAYMRMVVHPGEQAQVDWGHCGEMKVGNAERKLYVFVMVLSYSRAVYAEFTLNMKTSTFLRCHERAFEYFGGIPRIILYDNLKSVVLDRLGKDIRFNPEVLDFSGFYCYEPRPCNVYRGNEKGRVERTIRYIRDNFLSARPLSNLKTANESILRWCNTIANQRKWPDNSQYLVKSMWAKERPNLIALSGRWLSPKEILSTSTGKTPWVNFDLNSYSVPPNFVGKPLTISAGDESIELLCENKVIATHGRSYDRERFIECKNHRQELTAYRGFGRTNLFRENLVADFPAVEKILSSQFERGLDMATIVRHLYQLRYSHGDCLFSQALNEAVHTERYSTDSLRVILQQIEAKQKEPARVTVHLPERSEITSLEIEKRPLSTYDQL